MQAEADGENIRPLAKTLRFHPDDAFASAADGGWLRDDNGNKVASQSSIQAGKTYRFPNTVHITYGYQGVWLQKNSWEAEMELLADHFTKLKYHVEHHTLRTSSVAGYTSAEINETIGDPYIAIWANAGHGRVVSKGGRERSWGGLWLHDEATGWKVKPEYATGKDKVFVGEYGGHFAQHFNPHHRLRIVILLACQAGRDAKHWMELVAPGGAVYASPKDFPFGGSWMSLPKYKVPPLDSE